METNKGTMKKIFIIGAVALAVTSCGSPEEVTEEATTENVSEQNLTKVSVVKAEKKTFEHYFESSELTEQNLEGLLASLQALKSYLFRQNIITMSIKPKNIIYQRQDDQNGIAVIIDNIGNSDIIPISSHYRYFGRKKIIRLAEP